MTSEFEVIIAGGGVVGMTLALGLAHEGRRVALVEASAPAGEKSATEDFDPRVFALTRASEWILRHLGVWRHLATGEPGPFREMRVWEDKGEIHFDSADLAEPWLGHIVEHRVLIRALNQELEETGGVTWLRPRAVKRLHPTRAFIGVELDNGEHCRARLLVGADGGHSSVRELAGIGCEISPYGHHSLVATVKTSAPHRETAWQRFTDGGPLAFLPLAEPRTCSIVWSAEPRRIAELVALPRPEFHAELGEAFEHRLGEVIWSGGRMDYPLFRRHARQYVRPRLALAGDAAHTIHPLAGQGVNLGLLDVAALLEVLRAAREDNRDIGAFSVLRGYERWRRGHNLMMMELMGGFKQLFGNSLPPLRWARNLGMNLNNHLPWLKRSMMRRAMGLEGDLPTLARAGFKFQEEQRVPVPGDRPDTAAARQK